MAISFGPTSGGTSPLREADWRSQGVPREAGATHKPQDSDLPVVAALQARAEDLRGRLAADPKQLNEIHDLYAQYTTQNLSFPLDLEEHSLRLILDFVRPDDAAAATRLGEVRRMRQVPAPAVAPIDLDSLLAQIEAGVAERSAVTQALDDVMRQQQTPPLLLEMQVLQNLLTDDPARSDLKRRLCTVLRLLDRPVPVELANEVQADLLDEEYATDFQRMLNEFGSRVNYADMEPEFFELLDKVRQYSMTTVERLYALWTSVRYLIEAAIDGDFVEAGVWRGGSVMLMAHELLRSGAAHRPLWLFDTFAGLPRPDAEMDVDVLGNRGIDGWQAHHVAGETSIWAYADDTEVRTNMASTGYPPGEVHFVIGKVEDTVPVQAPEQIALLRIDTDWHASYRHLLDSLYDRLVPGGVLLLDDYGHFLGARLAVDEFRRKRGIRQPLLRVDYSCRMMIKP